MGGHINDDEFVIGPKRFFYDDLKAGRYWLKQAKGRQKTTLLAEMVLGQDLLPTMECDLRTSQTYYIWFGQNQAPRLVEERTALNEARQLHLEGPCGFPGVDLRPRYRLRAELVNAKDGWSKLMCDACANPTPGVPPSK